MEKEVVERSVFNIVEPNANFDIQSASTNLAFPSNNSSALENQKSPYFSDPGKADTVPPKDMLASTFFADQFFVTQAEAHKKRTAEDSSGSLSKSKKISKAPATVTRGDADNQRQSSDDDCKTKESDSQKQPVEAPASLTQQQTSEDSAPQSLKQKTTIPATKVDSQPSTSGVTQPATQPKDNTVMCSDSDVTNIPNQLPDDIFDSGPSVPALPEPSTPQNEDILAYPDYDVTKIPNQLPDKIFDDDGF